MTIERTRNEAMARALKEAGLTYEQLATEVRRIAGEAGVNLRTSRAAVAQWMAGRPPSEPTAVYIAEALARCLGRHFTPADFGWSGPGQGLGPDALLGVGIGPDPVDIVRRIGEADINRRKFLTRSAYSVAAAALPLGVAQAAEAQDRAASTSGDRRGAADVAAVRSMLEAFTIIDERQGGQHGRSSVAQYLRSDVADLARSRFARSADQADALKVAASVTYLAGWKAYDAGEHGLSQRYYLQALGLARESGDPLHAAWILRIMAHNGMDISRPEHTLDLAESALTAAEHTADPGLLSLFVVTHARALGAAGRGPEAAAEVRRAQDLVMRSQDEELPYWVALWGAPRATVASHSAKTFRALQDHSNAETQYAAATRGYGGGSRPRITALSLASEGREQAAQGHLEQACATWTRALDCFQDVYSARAVKQVGSIRRQLAVFHRRGVRPAAALDHQAHTWQRAHA